MYMNRDEKMKSNSGSRDYDICTTENGHKFVVKWSPQEDLKFYAKNRFSSSRMLSKSVPRRNKHMAKIRISRSLNFDMGGMSHNTLSPNSSSEGSSFEDNRHLSRAAKIMRALNNSNSPLLVPRRKINKSLNFDLSPSPKKSIGSNKSPLSVASINFSSPSPIISRNLNYDASSNGSISSLAGTSGESMDENQNQTPSQQRRIVKKSLNYSSPRPDSIAGSPCNIRSLMLRAGLKEKIDKIVKLSTPNSTPFKTGTKLLVPGKDITSTPRNLYQDFLEDDSDRPKTPENMFRIIPESMSAIKKSHKKERLSRRLDNGPLDSSFESIIVKEDEVKDVTKERPTTPIKNDRCVSPTFSVSSIKQSHKKDKSKRKSSVYDSEDDMSDTGSLFNYNCERDDEDTQQLGTSSANSPQPDEVMDHRPINNFMETRSNFSTPREKQLHRQVALLDGNNEIQRSASPSIVITSAKSPAERPSTPENRINFLQEVMKSSIKKSHKKLKDDKKKKLLRPRVLDATTPVHTRVMRHCNEDAELKNISNIDSRAATPENINSSRMLLNHFSSVKKSHKKTKHKKMLSSFVRRQKYISAENDKTDCDLNDIKPTEENTGLNDEGVRNANISCQLSFSPETSSTNVLKENKENVKVHSPAVPESSPKKRKNSSDDVLNSCSLLKISPNASTSSEYQHANEDFKIFTPIKKRRSYHRIPVELKVNSSDIIFDDGIDNICSSRCETPTTLPPECQDSRMERNFVTSVANIRLSTSPNKIPLLTVNNGQDAIVDSSGRRTPKNTFMESVIQISSIKKSHKKDKRASRLRRDAAANLDVSLGRKPIEPFTVKDSSNETNESVLSSPKPSTSSEGICIRNATQDLTQENYSSVKTPPNCLKVKAYMKLVQSASIKRSHKKVREGKRMSWLVQDHNVSDDGSIFSEEDKTETCRRVVQATDCAIGILNDNKICDTKSVNDCQVPTSAETNEQVSSLQRKGTNNYYENRSDDGSIFGEEERLESLQDDLKELEAAESTNTEEY